MIRTKHIYIALLSFLVVVTAWAQVAAGAPDPLTTAPSLDEITSLLNSLGGLKGASGLAISAVVVQGLMLAFRSKLGDMAGKYRYLLVLGLSVAAGVISLKLSGVGIVAALLHSSVLASLQVFINQGVKQFTEKTS